MRIGDIWNALAKPKNIPRLFALVMALFLIVGFLIPVALNADQPYTRPAPQEQVNSGLHLAPYDRGGEVLGTPGIISCGFTTYGIVLITGASHAAKVTAAVENPKSLSCSIMFFW